METICLPVDELIKKMWSTHTMEHHLALKKEISHLWQGWKWGTFILSEIRQEQKPNMAWSHTHVGMQVEAESTIEFTKGLVWRGRKSWSKDTKFQTGEINSGDLSYNKVTVINNNELYACNCYESRFTCSYHKEVSVWVNGCVTLIKFHNVHIYQNITLYNINTKSTPKKCIHTLRKEK